MKFNNIFNNIFGVGDYMRDENMNNKRNVILMFLFVMLSFAIISEVSAASEAEPDGTGFDPSIKSVNMTNHDFAGESDNNMQGHDNDFQDDVKFHNEQNSLDNSPELNGDKNIENEILYEQKDNQPDNLSIAHDFHDDGKDLDGMNPGDLNFTEGSIAPKDEGFNNFNFSNNSNDIPPMDLRDNNFTAVRNGEAMDDIMSNLIGLNNIAPNFSKNEANNSIPELPNVNVPNQPGFDVNNTPAKLPGDISKNTKKAKKLVKKSKKPKVKKSKKAKKPKKHSLKKPKKLKQ